MFCSSDARRLLSFLYSILFMLLSSKKTVHYRSNAFHSPQAFPSRPLMHCIQQLNSSLTKAGSQFSRVWLCVTQLRGCAGEQSTGTVLCCSGSRMAQCKGSYLNVGKEAERPQIQLRHMCLLGHRGANLSGEFMDILVLSICGITRFEWENILKD